MFKRLARFLTDPRLQGVDVDSTRLLEVHQQILESKPMIRGVFREFYDMCIRLDDSLLAGRGLRIELGAGTSFFKKCYPQVISTDIKPGPGLDMVVDAQQMPFESGSVRCLYAIHCFHHLPSPDQFFRELIRTVQPGGGCVLIEPYYSPAARFTFKRLFASEGFDTTQPEWDAASPMGVMQGANQALSYIVFTRDRSVFRTRHPELEIVHHRPLTNYPRYLISGGLNFRQLAPTFTIPVIKGAEFLLSPLATLLALHHVIVLRRK